MFLDVLHERLIKKYIYNKYEAYIIYTHTHILKYGLVKEHIRLKMESLKLISNETGLIRRRLKEYHKKVLVKVLRPISRVRLSHIGLMNRFRQEVFRWCFKKKGTVLDYDELKRDFYIIKVFICVYIWGVLSDWFLEIRSPKGNFDSEPPEDV